MLFINKKKNHYFVLNNNILEIDTDLTLKENVHFSGNHPVT